MQEIMITGRLGRDAVIRETSTGSRFVTMNVAVNSHIRNAEKTTWYEVSTFNIERLEKMIPYLTKGSSVIIVGELDASIQTGTDNVQRLRLSINADRVDFNSGTGVSGNTKTTVEVASDTTDIPEPVVATPEVPDDIPVTAPKKTTKKATTVAPVSADGEDDLPF